MKNSILFCAALLSARSSIGQEKKWHELEGVFQSPVNKEMYVRFTPNDSMIVAHLLWNNGEVHLLPDTGLAFVSKEMENGNPIRIAFQRDASGAVNRVSVANNGVWTRAPNYKPATKQVIPLPPDQLQKFVGLYQLKGDTAHYAELRIQANGLKMFNQWDDGTLGLFVPDGPASFFIEQMPILTLKFSQDEAGHITQFKAFNGNIWIRTSKPTLTAAQLKSYEGKFRSADDPDNQVQLIAAGNDLVVRESWNKKEIRLQPLTNTYFNDAKLSFPLQIVLENGEVKRIIILGNQTFEKVSQ